jgi:nucleoside-diphosphate-sugar epimerase
LKKKILITGGGGILGRILVQEMQKLEYELVVLERKVHKKVSNHLPCDITNLDEVKKIIHMHNPDIIIHLAGITGNAECEEKVHKAIFTNIMGTHNLLKACIKNKPKIIFASSREVYAETKEILKESSLLDPKNINGITKMFSEILIRDFHVKYKIPFVILRFSNFIGEANEKRGISIMIKNAIQENKITMYGGNQEIDLLYYNDAVNAIIKSVEYNKSEIFNIGTGKSITLKKVITKIETQLEKDVEISVRPIREFESIYCKLDISKAHKYLKFRASVNLDIILREMISRWTKK